MNGIRTLMKTQTSFAAGLSHSGTVTQGYLLQPVITLHALHRCRALGEVQRQEVNSPHGFHHTTVQHN